jgi:hypothetical protein
MLDRVRCPIIDLLIEGKCWFMLGLNVNGCKEVCMRTDVYDNLIIEAK